ncbi:hypothetical protein EDB81DRAFT_398572 [Dactylonectria macrodidyma]|uniref:C2H2-type domain-containing protein n=1 Tax=Dactylonectria macrodidyma TaxID=307937 RepID=A0A9P9F8L1_9HYPO|nr:hypothetical protein EDB81DRAFT_398572 [Dactylonectria macrodidyma]
MVRRREHKQPLRATVADRSIGPYKTESKVQSQAGLKNNDLEHIGGWSDTAFSILAASPTLDFSTQAVEPTSTALSAAALAKVEGHDLRPKKKSRRDTPPTSHPNPARSQSLDVKSGPEGNNQVKTPLFACPFCKKDGQKYQDCSKYELRRVKDVKQHICRKHTKHEYYCSSCSKGFSAKEAKDEHELGCQEQPKTQPDENSRWQRKELNVTNIRGYSPEEQWFSIWDTLFPGLQRPRSCYLGNNLEEMMAQIRDLWDRKRSSIICDVLKDENKTMDGPSLLNSAMQTVFNQFESEMATSNPGNKTQKQLKIPAIPKQQESGANPLTSTSGYQGYATDAEQDSQEEWQHVDLPTTFDEFQFCDSDGFLNDWEFTF